MVPNQHKIMIEYVGHSGCHQVSSTLLKKSVENETLVFILTRRMAKNVTIGKTLDQVHYYRKGAPGENTNYAKSRLG